MPALRPDISGASIVVVGSLNPAIFQPAWFAAQNLLSREEADNAKVQIINPQVSLFSTERYSVQVTENRFAATTQVSEPYLTLRDLVTGAFQVLEHTPITAIGLNRMMHFKINTEVEWHHLGDRLAPKEGWIAAFGADEGVSRPGMGQLEIRTFRNEPKGSFISVRVEPSLAVLPHGAFFSVNEHYQLPEEAPMQEALRIIRDRWEDAHEYAGSIAINILNWART